MQTTAAIFSKKLVLISDSSVWSYFGLTQTGDDQAISLGKGFSFSLRYFSSTSGSASCVTLR
jgi:hypothetical protein